MERATLLCGTPPSFPLSMYLGSGLGVVTIFCGNAHILPSPNVLRGRVGVGVPPSFATRQGHAHVGGLLTTRANQRPTKPPARPVPLAGRLLDFARSAGLVILSAVLLSLAFAPFGQFYFAWIALVPWLWVVNRSRRPWTAFCWSWLGGTCFYAANMWWLAAVTSYGMAAVVVYCGVYWGLTAWFVRRAKLLEANPLIAIPLVAAIWTTSEFARGNLLTGLPWLYVGHSQAPVLVMCQIADAFGAYGVTFWVVAVNVLVALFLIRGRSRTLLPAAAGIGGMVLLILIYGIWRMNQQTTSPGPTVLVVQSNYPQSNSGAKGADSDELFNFHLDHTRAAAVAAGPLRLNLAVWSETTVQWPLNHEALDQYTRITPRPFGDEIKSARDRLSALARDQHLGILVGMVRWDKFKFIERDGKSLPLPTDKRNTAFFIAPDGSLADGPGQRYDKIHLVPFGEYIPLYDTFLRSVFLALGPKYYDEYQLQNGLDNGMTVFHLPGPSGQDWKFVTPICFEDIDSRLCAAMFRPGADGLKRAQFMVNLTNDGWFLAGENQMHLQAAAFRCIENRAPMARSVNTGVSGFIDSVGRMENLLPARTEGTSFMQLTLDSRLSMYTRWGDFFAWMCVLAAASPSVAMLRRLGLKSRKKEQV